VGEGTKHLTEEKEFVVKSIFYYRDIKMEAEHWLCAKNKRKAKKAFKKAHPDFEIVEVKEK
jgi:hypothetical protein